MDKVSPALVMALYQEYRRKYKGQEFYRPAKSQYRFFERTAKLALELKAPPEGYIGAQFMLFPVEGKFPMPSQLATSAAQQRWLFCRTQFEVDWLKVYLAQLVMIKAFKAIYPERSLVDIILDPQTPLHAAFRVLMCRSAARKFLPEAQREILNSLKLQQFLERTKVNVRAVFKV